MSDSVLLRLLGELGCVGRTIIACPVCHREFTVVTNPPPINAVAYVRDVLGASIGRMPKPEKDWQQEEIDDVVSRVIEHLLDHLSAFGDFDRRVAQVVRAIQRDDAKGLR